MRVCHTPSLDLPKLFNHGVLLFLLSLHRLFDGIESVGDRLQSLNGGSATTIDRTYIDIRVESVDISANSEFMVEVGGPSVEFPQDLLPGASSGVPLVLANIRSDKFQAGLSSISDSGTIGRLLFSVSISNTDVANLANPVKLKFPKVSAKYFFLQAQVLYTEVQCDTHTTSWPCHPCGLRE